MIKIIKTIHFDTEDTNCNSDYYSIDMIVYKDDDLIYTGHYGDWYHDKGEAKCEAILHFIKQVLGEYELEVIKTNDGVI